MRKRQRMFKEQQETQVVYIGPTIKGKLKKDTVFATGIPRIGKEVIEKNPAMKALFVPLDNVAEAKKQVETENSALNIMYKKAEGVI